MFVSGLRVKEHQPVLITLYSVPSCQPCRAVKRWLDKRGIPFTEVDASQSLADTEAIKALGYTGTPVTIVNNGDGDIHFGGFNPGLLETYCNPKDTP